MKPMRVDAYILIQPIAKRSAIMAGFMRSYSEALAAAKLPRDFISSVPIDTRRRALGAKEVFIDAGGHASVIFEDMDEDEIVHMYENAIQ